MLGTRLKTSGWILLWLILLLTALTTRPPVPIDETRYLSVAWEMWQSHHFLVPHINGHPYSQKPPLLFWLILAGWKVFGVNQWSARMTAPLFGLLAVLLTRYLAGRLWPEQEGTGDTVSWFLIGTGFWALYSTLTMFDTLITCCALTTWTALWKAGRGSHIFIPWLVFGAAAGLGLLAKGPVILVYTVPPALLAPWWTEKRKIRSWTAWYLGLAAALALGAAIALAWAVPAARQGGPAYARAIFFDQTAGRVVHSFAHQRPLYWYILLLPVLFFPWSLSRSVWSAPGRPRLTSQVRFCLALLIPALVILSLVSGKQAHYLLPLAPAAALLAGQNPDRVSRESRRDWLPAAVLVILALALFILPRLPLSGDDAKMLEAIPAWLGLGPLTAALVLVRLRSRGSSRITSTATVTIALLIFFHLALAAPLHRYYDADGIAGQVRAAQAAGKKVAVYPARFSNQFQFAGRITTPLIPKETLAEVVHWTWRHPHQDLLLFLDREAAPFFSADGRGHPYRNGWLLFRPAAGMTKSYERWIQSRNHTNGGRLGQ